MQLLKALGLAITLAFLSAASAVPYKQSLRVASYQVETAGCRGQAVGCSRNDDCCADWNQQGANETQMAATLIVTAVEAWTASISSRVCSCAKYKGGPDIFDEGIAKDI
ncbi:hypothetical protein C8R43DRAFT_956148 [Mycena crocata]|nr:hypothetical protein C8R43DRAFT_956148 [Mycena crocata]